MAGVLETLLSWVSSVFPQSGKQGYPGPATHRYLLGLTWPSTVFKPRLSQVLLIRPLAQGSSPDAMGTHTQAAQGPTHPHPKQSFTPGVESPEYRVMSRLWLKLAFCFLTTSVIARPDHLLHSLPDLQTCLVINLIM